MLDHYIYGNCDRISPEAPVPVVEITSEVYTLGGAGNVLKNLIAFKCASNIISVIGDDDNAVIVLNELKKFSISAAGMITDKGRSTTTKSRILASKHQLIRLDREHLHTVNDEISDELTSVFKASLPEQNLVLISDYNKGLLSDSFLKCVLTVCREAGIKTLLDPKGTDFAKYKGVSLIKPNKKEAALATGIQITNTESLLAACIKIKSITDCEDVVITMSEEGIALYSDSRLTVIPTKVLGVIDVTGAGDTVLASLGVAIASGYSLFDACNFANHAAAIVISKVGSATATLEEINA